MHLFLANIYLENATDGNGKKTKEGDHPLSQVSKEMTILRGNLTKFKRSDLPYGTNKEDRILWNDGQLGTKVMQTNFADVDPVDVDFTGGLLDQTEQRDT